jgi:hypothetical protein
VLALDALADQVVTRVFVEDLAEPRDLRLLGLLA